MCLSRLWCPVCPPPRPKAATAGLHPFPYYPPTGTLSALAKIDAQREHMDGLNQW